MLVALCVSFDNFEQCSEFVSFVIRYPFCGSGLVHELAVAKQIDDSRPKLRYQNNTTLISSSGNIFPSQ